jgi:hypothetical protein
MTDCCAENDACWRSRTGPLGDGDEKDRSLCYLPVVERGETVPKCLAMIRDEVVAGGHARHPLSSDGFAEDSDSSRLVFFFARRAVVWSVTPVSVARIR